MHKIFNQKRIESELQLHEKYAINYSTQLIENLNHQVWLQLPDHRKLTLVKSMSYDLSNILS